MVRQYRHGTREVTLEIPGGMIDAGESPAAAAARGWPRKRTVIVCPSSPAANPMYLSWATPRASALRRFRLGGS